MQFNKKKNRRNLCKAHITVAVPREEGMWSSSTIGLWGMPWNKCHLCPQRLMQGTKHKNM